MTQPSKRILITGAAGGIGTGLCHFFAEQGWHVTAVDIQTEGLNSLAEQCPQQIKPLVLNCCDADAVMASLKECTVHAMINNAGGGKALRLDNCSVETWQADLQLNLNAAFYVTRTLLPNMLRNGGGSIINIGSVNSLQAIGHPAYSAAKAGLAHYTKSLALEYAAKGIRANCIAPGTVATPCWKDRLAKNPGVFEDVRRWYPGAEVVKPLDIAYLAEFLISERGRMINGATIPIDGGLSAGNLQLAQDLTQENFGDISP